jgi:hypothetical protein
MNRRPHVIERNSPRRIKPLACERHTWVKPGGRKERECLRQPVPWRTGAPCASWNLLLTGRECDSPSPITHHPDFSAHGRGCGVGRDLGLPLGLGVGVPRGVAVGVPCGVAVGLAIGEGVTEGVGVTGGVGLTGGVAVGVGVGVTGGVAVGVTDGVAVPPGVGVGEEFPPGTLNL